MPSYIDNFSSSIKGLEDRPKLVFLHGLMGSWTNWRRIITAFEGSFQVLAYDQRGHGKSFRPQTGYTPQDYAQDLRVILDELGWDKISLVGHSMGGRNAFVFAAQYPERVERLVVEDISPQGSEENVREIEQILQKVLTPFYDKRQAKEQILGAFENQVLAQYLYANIAEVSPGVFDWRFSKEAIIASVRAGHEKSLWEEWKRVKAPTLLIRGENSSDLTQQFYEKMLAENPLSKGKVILGSGHWVHFDQPNAFIQALQEFFDAK